MTTCMWKVSLMAMNPQRINTQLCHSPQLCQVFLASFRSLFWFSVLHLHRVLHSSLSRLSPPGGRKTPKQTNPWALDSKLLVNRGLLSHSAHSATLSLEPCYVPLIKNSDNRFSFSSVLVFTSYWEKYLSPATIWLWLSASLCWANSVHWVCLLKTRGETLLSAGKP